MPDAIQVNDGRGYNLDALSPLMRDVDDIDRVLITSGFSDVPDGWTMDLYGKRLMWRVVKGTDDVGRPIITHISNLGPIPAEAMVEGIISEALAHPRLSLDLLPILEAAIKISRFHYKKAKNDPNPEIVALGRWQHPSTKNNLLAGINLHYLDPEQVESLYAALPQIMGKDSLKAKYWEARTLVPDIMNVAYRSYDEKYIDGEETRDVQVEPPPPESPKQKAIEPLPSPEPEQVPQRPSGKEEMPRERTPSIKPKEPAPEPVAPPSPQPEVPEVPEAPKAPEAQKPQPEPEKAAEAPEEPKRGVFSKIKNLIGKLAGLIKGRKKPAEKKPAEKKEPEVIGKKPPTPPKLDQQNEVGRLDKIEKEHEAVSGEVNKLTDIEKEHKKPETPQQEIDQIKRIEDENENPHESFTRRLDAILESIDPITKKAEWTSEEYIKWHDPVAFCSHHPEIGGLVLEQAEGSKFLAVYNIAEDCFIVDYGDDHINMLKQAGWDWDDTIRFVVHEGRIEIAYDDPNYSKVAQEIMESPVGELLRLVRD